MFSNLDNIQAKKILMICAGTGVTPMYAILRNISYNRENVRVAMLYVNKTTDDVLLNNELGHLCLKSANITIRYAFTRNRVEVELNGRPTKEMVLQLGECDLALVCGPTGFNNSVMGICKELGYPTQIY